MNEKPKDDPLAVQCECGTWGRALSLCKECGEFLSVTLTLAAEPHSGKSE